jgi:sec-independent protein translocase protein TatA
MGGLSLWHWIIVALVILVLFGRGKISEMMGDFGKGLKSFRRGLGEEEPTPARLDTVELTVEPVADKTAG